MTESELAASVRDVLAVDTEAYRTEAAADADFVLSELDAGTFDNHQSILGLEYEFYAVTEDRWHTETDGEFALARVPRRLLELIGFEKELGLHNAEMTASPQPFNSHGLSAIESEVRARLEAALDCSQAEGLRLVSDAMWTIPPTGETARGYLTDSIDDGGVRIATNMSDAVRYHAMANSGRGEGFRVDAPGVDLTAETVMPESLITSIQPHYQVQQAMDLPRYFKYAVRLAGPLLALGVNAPFFPPDIYEDDLDPEWLLEHGWHENRIAVFESVLNSATETEKVIFPKDLDTVEEAVQRVVDDETMIPMPVDRDKSFHDNFATLRRKHGTYWRWVRPVFDGPTPSQANARIEFRPLPAQPTVRDSMALTVAFAGAMEGLTRTEHPVANLVWDDARDNFYAAMRNGIDADITWITADGSETGDLDIALTDLLEHAAEGLRAVGLDREAVDRYLQPLQWRIETGLTPAGWKREAVQRRLDSGDSLTEAIETTQRTYIEKQAATLIEGDFTDW
jgi:hypothetical protein